MIAIITAAAAAFTLAPAPHPHLRANTAASRAYAPQLSGFESGFPEGFGSLPAEAAAAASATSEAGDLSVVSAALALVAAVLAFNFATGFASGVGTAMAEDEQQQENNGSPKTSKDFGWLHADMRVPLPTWEELQVSCYRVGEMDSRAIYLCGSSSGQPGLTGCEPSSDFTKHYGKPVYVCQGAMIEDIHGAQYR